MIDKIDLIKKIKKIKTDSDYIVFKISPTHEIEDIHLCLNIIRKFNFKDVFVEATYEKLQYFTNLRDLGIENFILKLDTGLLSFMKDNPHYPGLKFWKSLRLHLRIDGWQDLEILNRLKDVSFWLDCKDIIISIKNKRDIHLPYVLNSIPIIYKYLNNKIDFTINLKNIDHKFFQTVIPLEIDLLSIEPNNTCNLFCPFCKTGKRKSIAHPDMSFGEFKKIIDQFPVTPTKTSLYASGEPLLNKDIFIMIRYLKNKGCRYVSIATNGHFLTKKNIAELLKSKLDGLIFSLDSLKKDVYEEMRRGGDFRLVLNNLKNLSQIKKRSLFTDLDVCVQFIITRKNENEIPLMLKFTENLGLKASFRIMSTSKKDFLPLNRAFHRGGGVLPPMRGMHFCPAPWDSIGISCNGSVALCCILIGNVGKKIGAKIGDLNKQRLSDIWNGEFYQNIRKQMLIDKNAIMYCPYKCPYDHSLTALIMGSDKNEEEEYFYIP